MNTKSRIAMLTLLGSLAAGAALTAQAADITVVNTSSTSIHPYFRSNCWNPAIASARPNEWVFFGAIGAHSQFTWPAFEQLLDPGCRHPVVRYTYALDGEAAPTGHGQRERTVKLMFDAAEPVYTLTISDVPVVTSVTPDTADRKHDDD